MEYTVGQLAKLAGVSARTLRYYDRIGLLKPETIRSSGYRAYGQTQVDRLQQILFYREMDVELEMIKRLLDSPEFEQAQALKGHLQALTARRDRLDALIETVKKTMAAAKGEETMTDEQKFEAFKQNLIDENERKYGAEARSLYGNEAVDASNAKMKAMTRKQFDEKEALSREVNEAIKAAFETGDPAGDLARRDHGLSNWPALDTIANGGGPSGGRICYLICSVKRCRGALSSGAWSAASAGPAYWSRTR